MAMCSWTRPCPFLSQQWKTLPPKPQPPVQLTSRFAFPVSSPASDMASLNVEPGGNCPWSARLFSGLSLSVVRYCQSFRVRPTGNMFGSKPGFETIASTSPFRGSIATIAPAWPFIASSAAACAL